MYKIGQLTNQNAEITLDELRISLKNVSKPVNDLVDNIDVLLKSFNC